VRLGDLEAQRYSNVSLRGTDDPMTIYVAPTTEGVVTVVCMNPLPTAAATDECDRAAASVRLERGRPLRLDPSGRYAATVDRIMRDIAPARRKYRKQLHDAKTRAEQAEASGALARAFDDARRKLSRVKPNPLVAEAHDSVMLALGTTAAGYGRMQRAALGFNRSSWEQGNVAVRVSEIRVQVALNALKELGYSII
jgi:hypothetical protein